MARHPFYSSHGKEDEVHSVTRREALVMASSAAAALVLQSGCQQGGKEEPPKETSKEAEPLKKAAKATTVLRRVPVYERRVECGKTEKVWTGPGGSTVHVSLRSSAKADPEVQHVVQRARAAYLALGGT